MSKPTNEEMLNYIDNAWEHHDVLSHGPRTEGHAREMEIAEAIHDLIKADAIIDNMGQDALNMPDGGENSKSGRGKATALDDCDKPPLGTNQNAPPEGEDYPKGWYSVVVHVNPETNQLHMDEKGGDTDGPTPGREYLYTLLQKQGPSVTREWVDAQAEKWHDCFGMPGYLDPTERSMFISFFETMLTEAGVDIK